jgi:hypothetical protein
LKIIISKKRRRNMKLKKILAQTLAAAMVLTSIPVANFTVFAAEDAAYVSDDAGTAGDTASTADATETDALPAPYGYKNLQLTVGTDVTITTSGNATDDMKKICYRLARRVWK